METKLSEAKLATIKFKCFINNTISTSFDKVFIIIKVKIIIIKEQTNQTTF